MLWVLFYVSSRVPGDLFAIAKTLIGSVGAWLIALLFIFFSFVNAVSLLRQLAECTLITAMPEADIHVVILFYGATVAIIVHYGIEPIARAAYLLMPFIVLGLSVSIALLTPYFDIHFLLPWQGNGLPAIFKTSLVIGGSNFEALVLVALAPAFQRIRTMKKAALFGLGGAAVIKTVFTVAYLLIFDVETGIEKTLPYYEMARLIYINRYVQRVEALLIVGRRRADGHRHQLVYRHVFPYPPAEFADHAAAHSGSLPDCAAAVFVAEKPERYHSVRQNCAAYWGFWHICPAAAVAGGHLL